MSAWERFRVWWPRRIDGEWCWLSRQERRLVPSGCGLYGGFSYEYRIDTGNESGHHYRNGGDLG
jgi:hypothetical protein